MSSMLVVILVVVLLAAAAFVVWKYVLVSQHPDVESSAAPVAPPVQPSPPPPPAPPPPPTSKIAMEVPPPVEIALAKAGGVETILADKTAVKEGDVVVRLVGDRPIQAEIANLTREQKNLQDAIDTATKKRDAAQASGKKAAEAAAQTDIANKQTQLANKQGLLASKTADLDKFLLHASRSGTFSPLFKQGAKVPAGGIVGKLQPDPFPVAVFRLADTRSFTVNASVELAIKPEQRVTCTVVDVQPESLKVACPADPLLADGADVTLSLPDAAPAPAGSPPPSAPSGLPTEGTGTGPAAPATDPNAAAGSATPGATEPPSAGSAN
jgi:hypothetical protein